MNFCEILIVIMARSICGQTLKKACPQLPLVETQKTFTQIYIPFSPTKHLVTSLGTPVLLKTQFKKSGVVDIKFL